MDLQTDDPGISKELAIFRKRELEHRFILERVLHPGMTVWDLGANVGYYALMEARLVGEKGRVYAVEPSPANVDALRRNVAINKMEDRIDVTPVGISNKSGTAPFHLSVQSNVNSFHPTEFRTGERAKHLSGKVIDVPVMDVQEFIEGKRAVDLVRMDIEGHEVEVFEAIAKAVRENNFSARILFEAHFPKYDDDKHDMRTRLRELFDLGYRARFMASTQEDRTHFHKRGYSPVAQIKTDGVVRGLYEHVAPEDAEWFLCDVGGVRTALLEKAV